MAPIQMTRYGVTCESRFSSSIDIDAVSDISIRSQFVMHFSSAAKMGSKLKHLNLENNEKESWWS